MGRILVKNGHSDGAPAVGGFQSDSRPPKLRGVSKFAILLRCAISGTNFEYRHFRCETFWLETAIPMELQRWADVSLICARRNYEGSLISHFRAFAISGQLIFRIIASDESHFGQKRPF